MTQGVTTQGVTTQGVTTQGVTTQGVTTQGVTTQGVTTQEVTTTQADTSEGITFDPCIISPPQVFIYVCSFYSIKIFSEIRDCGIYILVLWVLDNITNLFIHFPVCTIKTYNFVYIILSYVFLHLHILSLCIPNNISLQIDDFHMC